MSEEDKYVFEGKLTRADGYYDLGTTKAKLHPDGETLGYAYGARFLYDFCQAKFQRITGIKLKMGEEVMVKITIETTPIKVNK